MKLLFLHGLGQRGEAWGGTLRELEYGNVECPDILTDDGQQQDFMSLADRLELLVRDQEEPTVICGLSLGAVLALELYLRHPDKVAGLVLIAPQHKTPTRLIDLQNAIFRILPKGFFAATGMTKETMMTVTSSMRTLDYTERLDNITCPVTLVCGEKDRVNMKAAVALASLIEQSELIVVGGAGHEVNIDAPTQLAEIVQRFYEDVNHDV